MKKLKSITHCVIAIAITMTSMNLGVFGALTTYANELIVGNDSYQPIKPMEELLTEEPINLVSPTVDSVLTQNIRERILKLNQPETEVEEADVVPQPETEVEEAEVELQPETEVEEAEVEEAEVELQPETEVEEADVDSQPETEVEEADVALQPETEVEESDVALQPETEVEEADVEPQPETEVEEADVEPQPETEVEEADIADFSLEKNTVPIVISYYDSNNNPKLYATEYLDLGWEIVKNNSGEVTITFQKDYKINQKDLNAIKQAFKADHVVITATSGVTVTVDNDLEFYRDYDPRNYAEKSITFENIKLEFTDEHKIISNGLWIHMGQGIEMLGNKFPKIQLGSIEKFSSDPNNINWQIYKNVYLFIESGTYSEVIVGSESIGRRLEERSETYLFGGTVKKLSYGQNATTHKDHIVYLLGGQLLSAIDGEKGALPNTYGLKIIVIGDTTQVIDDYTNISDLQLGEYGVNGILPGKVEITGSIKFKTTGTLAMVSGSTLIINESADPMTLYYGWMDEDCTLVLPANKSKDHIPLTFETSFYVPQNTKLTISNTMTEEEFYLISQKGNPLDVTTWIVDESEEFYLESREESGNTYYFKAKKKITGPLIYDLATDKMYYHNETGQEIEAIWFNEKLIDQTIDLSNLSYEGLAKYAHYYILSPQPITLKIRGSGSNKIFKFSNERHTDRQINIEFINLNLIDSELNFENVNSITIEGENSITQNNTSTNPALTYSLASNQSTVSFKSNSSFTVYSNDSDDYQIKDQINNSNSTNKGNVSVIKLSFEGGMSQEKNLQLYSTGTNGSSKKFKTKANYPKMSLLLPSDSNSYILCDGDTQTCNSEDAYYYQSSGWTGNVSQNSGPIGTNFSLNANLTTNHYKVNNQARVHVKVAQFGSYYYYIFNTLKDAMEYVDHTHGSHEVTFIGNYNINNNDDVHAVENHSKPTNAILFKTKVDDVKYILTVSKNLILKQYDNNQRYPVKFDQIKWKSNSDDIVVYANGRSLTFGSDVDMVGSYAPSIMGGHSTNANLSSQNQSITIQSGIYKTVMGQHSNMTGDATVTIENGTFNGQVIGATDNASGTVTLCISGGDFPVGQVYGAAKNATSNVEMEISNGTFTNKVSGASGSSRSSVTLTISGGTFAQEVSGASENASGQVTMTISRGTFANEVIGATNSTSGTVNMTISDGIFNGTIRGSSDNSRSRVTLMIESGTFANEVIGSGWSASGQVTLTIENGTFNEQVIGAGGSASGQVTLTIENGTFNEQVIGARRTASAPVNMTISGGTFAKEVSGATESASNTVNMTISGGRFNGQVIGATGSASGELTLTIENGTFANKVIGSTESASGKLILTISGGTFAQEVSGATGNAASIVIIISGGRFNGQFIGATENASGELTLTISDGTFNAHVIGAAKGASSQVTLNIKNGVFNHQVIGVTTDTTGRMKLTIENGTFNAKVIGANDNASGDVTLTISGGTFAKEVNGATDSASGIVNMTISDGTFKDMIKGATISTRGAVTLTIQKGNFEKNVIASNNASLVVFNILGGNFTANVAGTEKTAPVEMTISDGTFNGHVYGHGSSYGGTTSVKININGGNFQSMVVASLGNTPVVSLNIRGGTFQSEVIGQDSKQGNTVNINIDGKVSIPTIKGYDLLSIGETTPQSILTVNNSITSTGVQDETVKLQNQSTLQLTGSNTSIIKVLEIVGADNTLMLAMNQSSAPLIVKNSYNFNNNKLNLTDLGSKATGSSLIEFSNSTTDIGNFNFTGADYYIREINSGTGQNLVMYEKMDPSKITFKWDVSNNDLKYSLDGNSESDVWWHSIKLSEPTVTFDEANLMMYKGTEIFKNPSKLTEINFEISGATTNKDISINSVTTTPWNLKLNAVKLTDSTVNAPNLNQLEIHGQNVMTSLNGPTPIFSYSFSNSLGSNKVIASDDQSNLVVYSSNTNAISLPTQGDTGQILSLSFDEVGNQDETVRLVDANNKEIGYTIPSGTEKMSILFGNSSATRTYQLCHGTSSCTGSSLYVAGVNDATFKDSFEIQSNNQVADYQNVRRANPIKTINVSFPASVSFNIDLGTASSNVVDNTNWQHYFSSQPIEMINNNQSIKDVYTDQKGTIHHFGKTPTNLEVEYNGVEKGTGSTMELVSPSDLDTSSNGLKVALSLTDSNNTNSPIPLYENSVLPNSSWNVNPTDKLKLEIKPYFDNNKNYFFRDYSTLTQYQANYKLKFKFNANP